MLLNLFPLIRLTPSQSSSDDYFNLSKIKPKFRTSGNITGNFGRPKSKAGSSLSDIGYSDKENIKVVRKSEYINRLYEAMDKTNDPKIKSSVILR